MMKIKFKTILAISFFCHCLSARADSSPGENDQPHRLNCRRIQTSTSNTDEIVVRAREREYTLYFSYWGGRGIYNPNFISVDDLSVVGHYSGDREFFAEHFAEEIGFLSREDRQYVIKTMATLFESLEADKTTLSDLKNSVDDTHKLNLALQEMVHGLNRNSKENPPPDQLARLDRIKQQVGKSSDTFNEYIDEIFEVVGRTETCADYVNSQRDFFSEMIKCAGKF